MLPEHNQGADQPSALTPPAFWWGESFQRILMDYMFLILNILHSWRRESSLKPNVSLTWFSQPWLAQKDQSPVALKSTTISFILPVNLQVIQPTYLNQGVHNAPILSLFPLTDALHKCRVLGELLEAAGLESCIRTVLSGGCQGFDSPVGHQWAALPLDFCGAFSIIGTCQLFFGSFSSNWARWISVEARQWVKSLRWNTDYHHLLVLRVFSSQEGTRTYKVAGRQLESLQFLETQVTWGDAKDDLSPAISVISVWCAWALSHHSVRQTYSGQRVRWSNISNSEGWSNHSSACSVIWFFLLFTHLKCSEHAGMEARGDLRKK